MAERPSSEFDCSAQNVAYGNFSIDQCREAALAEINEARFSWFHVKVCLVAGIGFFADAYDIFAINLAAKMFDYLPESYNDFVSSDLRGFCLKAATPIGTFFGQIIFGCLADRVGRKRMYGIELIIMIIGTFGQALAGASQTVSLIGTLIAWRFIMGVGIGGDYPLSAIIVSEFSPVRIRGRLITAVFACQGWGNLAAGLVTLVLVGSFKAQLTDQASSSQPGPASPSIDHIWRVLIGLGCIPAVLGLYFRLTIPETPRFTMDISRNLDQALADIDASLSGRGNRDPELMRRLIVPKAGWKDFVRYFSRWSNLRILAGAAYSWFAIDFAFYGLGLNTNSFIQDVVFTTSQLTLYDQLYDATANSLLISAAGLIPGYWVAFLLIDRWGRKPIQLLGFSALSILFIVTGATYDKLTNTNTSGQKVAVFLFCLSNFFQNFGPNTTTFIFPGELFPTRYRSTCHGIAGAIGKLGAIISLLVFYELQIRKPSVVNENVGHIFLILGFVMMTGIGSTLWLPETNGRTLEDLSNERRRDFIQGHTRFDSPMQQLF